MLRVRVCVSGSGKLSKELYLRQPILTTLRLLPTLRQHHIRSSPPITHQVVLSHALRQHGRNEQAGKDGELRAQTATAMLQC